MKQLQVMNFLNEIASNYPNAISLAAGRPNPRFFNESDWEGYRTTFVSYYAKVNQCSVLDSKKNCASMVQALG